MSAGDYRSTFKLRFPSTGPGMSKYLLFTDSGSLMIEMEDYNRPYDERYTWLEPDDTCKFLEAVGEGARRPEFVDGQPSNETRVLLRRLITQFSSTDDLDRCWRIIGVHGQSFAPSYSTD